MVRKGRRNVREGRASVMVWALNLVWWYLRFDGAGHLGSKHTSISNEIRFKWDSCKALCVVHHSRTPANVAEHEDDDRPVAK